MEKPGRQYLNPVIKISITCNMLTACASVQYNKMGTSLWLQNIYNLSIIKRKHQRDPNRIIFQTMRQTLFKSIMKGNEGLGNSQTGGS